MSTFKKKLGVTSVVAATVLSVIAYVALVRPAAKIETERAKLDVKRATQLVQRMHRLQAYDLVALAKEFSMRAELIDAIQGEAEDERRQGVFDAITAFDRNLRKISRKADFLAVVDTRGRIVARDLNIEDMYGEKLARKAVFRALAGRACSDVWRMRNRMVRVGLAPVSTGGEIIGAVAIAYDFTAAGARRESELLHAQVVYFQDDAARASSFSVRGGEDSSRVKLISKALLKPDGVITQTFAKKTGSDVVETTIGGRNYVVGGALFEKPVSMMGVEPATQIAGKRVNGTIVDDSAERKVGFAIMVDLDERLAHIILARWSLIAIALVMLLVMLGIMWTVSRHFVSAEDRLELGVNEVINGNTDYVFDTLQEFEGLANALNVMVARLLGRPEPGEEEDGGAAWQRPDVLTVEELELGASDIDVQSLAAEPENAYYARVFREYVQARTAAGLSVEGITEATFTQKLRANENVLRAKHKCNLVRFVVHSAGGRVGLRPVRLG